MSVPSGFLHPTFPLHIEKTDNIAYKSGQLTMSNLSAQVLLGLEADNRITGGLVAPSQPDKLAMPDEMNNLVPQDPRSLFRGSIYIALACYFQELRDMQSEIWFIVPKPSPVDFGWFEFRTVDRREGTDGYPYQVPYGLK